MLQHVCNEGEALVAMQITKRASPLYTVLYCTTRLETSSWIDVHSNSLSSLRSIKDAIRLRREVSIAATCICESFTKWKKQSIRCSPSRRPALLDENDVVWTRRISQRRLVVAAMSFRTHNIRVLFYHVVVSSIRRGHQPTPTVLRLGVGAISGQGYVPSWNAES